MPTWQPSRDEDARFRWGVVAASMLVCAATFGIPSSFGVLFKAVQEELQGSRTTISGAVSVYIFLQSAVAILWGWCADRYGIRLVIGTGSLLIGLGLFLTSRISEMQELYLTYGTIFAVGVAAVYVPLVSNVAAWFDRRRGLALGMVASGTGLGTIALPLIVERLVSLYGWRTAFVAMALVAVAVILAAVPFLRSVPRKQGAAPGRPGPPVESPSVRQVSVGQALRGRAFWVVFFMYLLSFLCLHMVLIHLVPRATDAGVASIAAAGLVSAIGAFSIVGKLVGGAAGDRFGGRRAFIAVMLLQGLAFLWLSLSYQTWMFYLFAIVFGLSYGGWMPLFPALAAQLFGARHLGAVFGALTLGAALGGAAGPALAGYVFDAWGSYSVAFVAGAAVSLVGLALAAGGLARAPRLHTPESWSSTEYFDRDVR